MYKSLDSLSFKDVVASGIPIELAGEIHRKVTEIVRNYGSASPETWSRISKHVLTPTLPFSLHQLMYYGCYKDFKPDPPAWIPDPESALLTNVGRLLERRGKELLGSKYDDPISSFPHLQEFSVSNPEVYWETILDELCVYFSVPPDCILQSPSEDSCISNPGGKWLPGTFLNPAKNCLVVNSKRSLDDIVIRWRDEGGDDLPVKSMKLKELQTEVWYVALHLIDPVFVHSCFYYHYFSFGMHNYS
ncbi:putative acyl-activating enzyme 17, peroxisomal [Hibiscus syriacus]|uniref:Acyl-activating enzyme 17, peroxisomal n=1 Tax=Hibiscus syriacus TaxID=106335 RepID=A0A6A3CUQ0_HIBSY|nr:probable acyl-activating enzyme 17, peroxisomal [Hibiscus syriacus]KAE8732204.1 putative acyl-activating enzyme 17, peroxisomal [Hibiscus syriacus]